MSSFLQTITDFFYRPGEAWQNPPPPFGDGLSGFTPPSGVLVWVERLISQIISSPVLLILVLAPVLIGFSVGLLKRIKNM